MENRAGAGGGGKSQKFALQGACTSTARNACHQITAQQCIQRQYCGIRFPQNYAHTGRRTTLDVHYADWWYQRIICERRTGAQCFFWGGGLASLSPTLERLIRLRCPVLVRMQLQRQLPVRLLDLVVARAPVHPEHAVVPFGLGVYHLIMRNREVNSSRVDGTRERSAGELALTGEGVAH